MGIWDIFKKDPEAVAARQAARTARAQARAEVKIAKQEARVATSDTRADTLTHVYDKVHGSVSSVGSGILGAFGIDAPSESDRELAAIEAQGRADAAVAAAGRSSAPAEPGFLDKYGLPLGLGVLGLLGLSMMGKGK